LGGRDHDRDVRIREVLGEAVGGANEAGALPRLLRKAVDDLGGLVVQSDHERRATADRAVDTETRLRCRRSPGAAVGEDRTHHTDVWATPRRAASASRHDSMNESSCGSTPAAERTRWWA